MLNHEQIENAKTFFKDPKNQKNIMVTHEAPKFIADLLL
jgi:hypothetical protein